MRPTRYRHGRSLPLSFFLSLLVTLLLAGCELPFAMSSTAMASDTPSLAAPAARTPTQAGI